MPSFLYTPNVIEALREAEEVLGPRVFQAITTILNDRDRQIEDRITDLDITSRVVWYAAPSTVAVPKGWLLCDGQAVSRVAYKNLFDTIGTTWGVGDGSTTFNVPDLRDRTAYGTGGTVGAIGNALGSGAAVAQHSHGLNGHTHGSPGAIADGAFVVGHDQNHSGQTANHGHVGNTNGHSHNNQGGVVFMNCNAVHGHAGGCGQLAESPSGGGCTGFGCNMTTTVNGDSFTTAGVNSDHSHNGHSNHSVGSHTHFLNAENGNTTNTGTATTGNYPPGVVGRYLIRI